MKKLFQTQKGLTLTELLVTMSIISILISVTVIGYSAFIKKSAISNDELIANRVNTVLEEIKSDEMLDSNTVAIIVQQELGDDIYLQSNKYNMNIYYDTDTQTFEVMSNEFASQRELFSLEYYLNLITFHIDKTYIHSLKGKYVKTFDGPDDTVVNLFLEGNNLLATVRIYETNKINAPEIDLSKIIYAKKSSNLLDNIRFEIKSTDLREEDKSVFVETSGQLQNSFITHPGQYEIIAYSEDYPEQTFSIGLCIKNVYYFNEPAIYVSNASYTTDILSNGNDTYNLTLTFPDLLKAITIKDYDNSYSFNGNFTTLRDFNLYGDQYTNNTDIFIEVGNKIYELNLNIDDIERNKLIYSVTFESVAIDKNDIISITYRYQGTNGAYCYFYEKIPINLQQ